MTEQKINNRQEIYDNILYPLSVMIDNLYYIVDRYEFNNSEGFDEYMNTDTTRPFVYGLEMLINREINMLVEQDKELEKKDNPQSSFGYYHCSVEKYKQKIKDKLSEIKSISNKTEDIEYSFLTQKEKDFLSIIIKELHLLKDIFDVIL